MDESGRHGLTARELQCLDGVAQHKRTKVIAAELGLAPKTVDAYIASAARKLGVGDRDSAVRVLLERDGRMDDREQSTATEPRRAGMGSASVPMMEGADPLWGESPSAKTRMVVDDEMRFSPDVGRLMWPFPTRGRERNDLSVRQSLVWIVVLTALMLSAATIYMLGMRMLAEQL